MKGFIIVLCVSNALFGMTAADAQTDVFMRAVSYALTGTDNGEATAVDRRKCVFDVFGDVFHLNNVHMDRIEIQRWKQTRLAASSTFPNEFVTVTIHGDETVFETTTPGAEDDGSEAARIGRRIRPDLYRPSHISSKERTLRLPTADIARVVRAWRYIYDHGCVGKKSPF
jgi:hypothetical protein